MEKFEIEIGGNKIEFEIKNLAERANSDIMVKCGETQVFTTCVMSDYEAENLGFLPLTVNYEERYYAAGKIFGSRYIRREGKPSDNATVISRLIDRAIRPLFDDDLRKEIQVISTSLSWDEKNDPDILGLLSASLALLISNIPWQGPIGAVRIAQNGRKLIVNPTYEQRENSPLDIIFAGIEKNGQILVNMIDANAQEAKEDIILQAFKKALPEIKKLIDFQEKVRKELGQEKMKIEKIKNEELEKEIKKFLSNKIEEVFISQKNGLEKNKMISQLKQDTIEFVKKNYSEQGRFASSIFEKELKKIVQENVLEKERRIDGRKLDEIRQISCEVALISRTHGSGLFCRGNTKSLSILTLAGPREQQLIEGMEFVGKKRFLHHYNFPPYSTGEVKRLAAPSRREIGHGILAERALFPVIPNFDDFPYTIRIVSEMLCSNGSTSMASVCSSSLALMDAGVPINRPMAGIAIGLMSSENLKNWKLLTDIQGPEDFNGDMDFKISGTEQGFTALQMDVKIPGISEEILEQALIKGKKAQLEILEFMKKVIAKPRAELSPFAPRIYKLDIPCEKIGEVIGAKGRTIKRITEETGAEINIEDDGSVYITAETEESAKKAMAIIKNITREIKIGETLLGKVKNVTDFGAFLEIAPGKEGLLHNSQMKGRLKPEDKVLVRVNSIDEQGRVNLVLAKTQQKYARRIGN